MKPFVLLILIAIFFSCQNNTSKYNIDSAYTEAFETFKVDRAENRINYLQLCGLFKLDSLENTFGSASENSMTVNIEGLPAKIGSIFVGKEASSFSAENEVLIKTKEDSVITDLNLTLGEYGSSVKLYHERLNWQVITRAGQLYLRVWDTKNPAIDAFKGFERFELDPEFIFDGTFTYYDTAKTEEVKSELGVNTSTNFIGYVSFEYQGESYQLDVGSSGFTMVSDETSGDETYGGGRYIYFNLPKANGPVTLDFNRLYNPPCAFSEYTTCLYPPRQNALSFKLKAGEIMEFSE